MQKLMAVKPLIFYILHFMQDRQMRNLTQVLIKNGPNHELEGPPCWSGGRQ